MKKAGINQTLELITLVAVLAGDLHDANADGKVNVFDLPKFFDLIGPAKDAMKDLKEVPDELADLDEDEFAQLTEKIREIVDPTLPSGYSRELTEAAKVTAGGIVSMLAIIRRHKNGEEVPSAKSV